MLELKLDWTEGWDEEAGLWRQEGAGHTAPVSRLACVHPAPTASSRLLLAAHLHQLEAVKAGTILQALRDMQEQDGERRGCLKWYLEEPGPVDTNAAFFVALGLIPLRLCHGGDLDARSRETLDAILDDLRAWFDREAGKRMFYYPNKFLGDVVCAWLLGEICGAPAPSLVGIMADAARDWHEHGWGWGEHMSDVYSCVCLDELSLLLLFSRSLPDGLRTLYTGLFRELLAIDDAYGEGPRVPAIRTYDFLDRPARLPYRSRIRPIQAPFALAKVQNQPVLGPLFHGRGWERLAPPPPAGPRSGSLRVPCFGGSCAEAWLAPDIRVGGMSRYPLMAGADRSTWGLSWQSMPAAFWSPEGLWGVLAVGDGRKLGRPLPSGRSHAVRLPGQCPDQPDSPADHRADLLPDEGRQPPRASDHARHGRRLGARDGPAAVGRAGDAHRDAPPRPQAGGKCWSGSRNGRWRSSACP
jgi:hypothetical protein